MKGHLRIKKAAKLTAEVLEGKRNLTKGEILKLADYSDVTSKEPDRVMDGIQFKEELALYGFTAENVKKVLGSIMTSPLVYEMVTPDNMIRASSETAKILGLYAPDKLDVRTAVIAKITFNKPQ